MELERTMYVEEAADVVVALDGSGAYTTIAAALKDAPRRSMMRHTIFIKGGLYKVSEPVVVEEEVWNLTLAGDGVDITIISGDRSFGDGYNTYETGTLRVFGQGFIAHDFTVENTAGAAKHQAVAFHSESDGSVVYRCAILGYQDTLYAKKKRQFYHDCRIEGTVDFIFGDATAVFQKCTIIARMPLRGQKNTITAQGRTPKPDDNGGFSFQFCDISASDDLSRADPPVDTYLGRPWKLRSRVVFMQCSLSDVVHPDGWLKWENNPEVSTLFYAEYENQGAGADVSRRVSWPGYHLLKDESEANQYTVHNFIQGDEWLPATGVDYTPGLGQ